MIIERSISEKIGREMIEVEISKMLIIIAILIITLKGVIAITKVQTVGRLNDNNPIYNIKNEIQYKYWIAITML
jgi:hypothetical protein